MEPQASVENTNKIENRNKEESEQIKGNQKPNNNTAVVDKTSKTSTELR